MPNEPKVTPDGIPLDKPIEETKIDNVLPQETPAAEPAEKKEAPQEPVKETTAEDKTIDFSEFIAKKDLSENVVPTKVPVAPEPKKDIPPARDLSDIAPEDAPLFKQMSNEAFSKLKPLYLEHKKLKDAITAKEAEVTKLKEGRLPDSYFEHPEGFRFDPEYTQQESIVNSANFLVNHWREQLKAIRDGAAEFEAIVVTPEGKYAIEKRPADSAAEADILLYYNNAQHALINAKAETAKFQSTFKEKFNGTKKWVSDFESTAFALFDKEEGKQLAKAVEDTVNSFPAAIRQSLAARLLAKSLVTNQQQFNIIKQLASSPNLEVAKKEDKAKAGPTSAETMSGAGSGESEVTIDAFERLKAGL
jgi:hypothetical protein